MSCRVLAVALLVAMPAIAAGCTGSGSAAPPPYAGSVLAFVRPGEVEGLGVDNTDLVAVSPSGRPVADMTAGTAGESQPVWSANGRRVAFRRAAVVADGRTATGVPRYRLVEAIYVMNTNGGNLRRVCGELCGSDFTISPDGRYVAYVAQPHPPPHASTDAGEVVDVFDSDTGHTRTFCRHDGCGYGLGGLDWSPDGASIALSNQTGALESFGIGPLPSQIWVVDVASGRATQLTGTRCRRRVSTCTTDSSPAWSPDGKEIAFSRYGPIYISGPRYGTPPSYLMLMNADGSDLHVLTRCSSQFCPQVAYPAWSPDGRLLAIPSDVQGSTIAIVSAAGGAARTIHTCVGRRCETPSTVAWSPNSRTLAFTTDRYPRTDVYTIGVDGRGMRAVGIAAAYDGVAWLPAGAVAPTAGSHPPAALARPPRPSGEVAYAGQESRPHQDDRSIWVQPAAGGARRLIFRRPSRNLWADTPRWSPDGRTILFDNCCSGNRRNIFAMSATGAGVHALTSLPYGASGPAWSPDGREIVFAANTRYSDTTIDVMDADGSHVHTITSGARDWQPAWSPDGRWIAFVRGMNSQGSLLEVVRPDGSGLHPVIDLPGTPATPTWSPDGRWIAFEWDLGLGTGDNIYEVHPNGTGLRRLTSAFEGAVDPAFSPDGRWIAFASGLGGRVDIYLTPVDAFAPVRLSPRQGVYDDPDWRR